MSALFHSYLCGRNAAEWLIAMKKMLITGASGFLGSRVARYFSGTYELYTPSHAEMDITREEAVQAVMEAVRPDVVIHCAAMADVGQCAREPEVSWARNVTGSVNMAKAAAQVNAKCILCSSDQVYFAVPNNLYAKEKLEAERMGLEVNPDSVFLRLTWMYDPALTSASQHSDFFTNLLPKVQAGESVAYAIHDKRGITDVNEVIRNMEKVIEIPGGVYDFGAPNDKTMHQTVVDLFAGLGLDTGRVQENREAFQNTPRDITVKQDTVNRLGIYFTDTTEALVEHFKKHLKDR